MAGLSILDMRLTANAAEAARRITEAFPDAYFSSGRRDMASQARVMAYNVCVSGINWLDIYGAKWARIIKALKTHVSENPNELNDRHKLALSFYDIFNESFKKDIAKFPHITGRAFDIRWPRLQDGTLDKPRWQELCDFIENLPPELGLELLLRKEGNVEVIHAQFATPFTKEMV